MRIWDIEPRYLCRAHLLGEHRELHALWNILTIHGGKGGYSQHPETKRWRGKLRALYNRHRLLVEEMGRRNYRHFSDLEVSLAVGDEEQTEYIDSIDRQLAILTNKPCQCPLDN